MNPRTALITGGASGIGRAVAERLIELGSTVTVADVRPDGPDVAKEIGAHFVRLDVTDSAAWTQALDEVEATVGPLDLIHLNAGIMSQPAGADIGADGFRWVTVDAYDRVMRVNVVGVINGVLEARRRFAGRGPADVLVTASIAGMSPAPYDPIYATSKHAVIGFVRSVAPLLEEEGIRIQTLCPGGVDTPIIAPDMRAGRTFAPPKYLADATVHALENGACGDVWMATDADVPYWRYEFNAVRATS